MKKLLAISILSAGTLSAAAQDAQLSQLHNTPLLLNPAQTGLYDKTYRLSGAYRNTSFSGGTNA
ncbi:type IX secretion system membrane protein PorP/SprF, partial [Flaviaesturariibacter aridisoli]